jgi:cell division protein FtsB
MKLLFSAYKEYLIVLIFIVIFAFITIYGDRGFIHLYRLNQEMKRMETTNERIKQENRALKKEVLLLKNNSEYLDETIRKEVGLVRKNETVYEFKK